jgi:hypothetical protein
LKNIKTLLPLLFFSLTVFNVGCGNAKAIRSYQYQTNKTNLEKAVRKVIGANPAIYLDTTRSKVRVRRNRDNPNDTSTVLINLSEFHSRDSAQVAAYFNRYIKFKIKIAEAENYYEFHFYGDEEYWKSSPTSTILLSTAQDKLGNGLNQGHNERGQFHGRLADDLSALFEMELLEKVDKELNLKHTVE